MTVFKKKLIINGGIIFAVLVITAGILYAIIDSINTTNAEILVLKNQMRNAQVEIKEYSGLKSDSDKADAALAVIHKAIPLQDDLFTFRSQTEKLASARNLRSGFSFGSESAPDKDVLGYVNFNMSIQGAFGNALSFVKDLENSGYLLEVAQVSITGAGSNASGRIDGRVFFTK